MTIFGKLLISFSPGAHPPANEGHGAPAPSKDSSGQKHNGSVSLATLNPGQGGKITAIHAKGILKRRLMDMGMLVGESVRVEKLAPLGDPMEVSVRGYRLSFRKKEAEGVMVQEAL